MLQKIKGKMSSLACSVNEKTTGLYIRTTTRCERFAADVEGSDTTEKIGMVVVAIVIVGLVATAAKTAMPDIFASIFATAKTKLEGIF